MAQSSSCCQLFSSSTHQFKLLVLVAAIACLSSVGCWEEVHFTPDKSPGAIQKVAKTDEKPPLEQTSPASDPAPSSEELFGKAVAERTPTPPAIENNPVLPSEDAATDATEPSDDSPLDVQDSDALVLPQPPVQKKPSITVEGGAGEPVDPFGEEQTASTEKSAEEVVSPTAPPTVPTDVDTAEIASSELLTWRMSSEWSFAAALQAKGSKVERYEKLIQQASGVAKLLKVSLPALPEQREGTERVAASLNYLLEDAVPRLTEELRQRHGAQYGALAELAIKTHVLLLCYTPKSSRVEPIIAAVRRAAEQSGLDEKVWRDLVDLLTARADFKPVKAAIFRLHQQALISLGGQPTQ